MPLASSYDDFVNHLKVSSRYKELITEMEKGTGEPKGIPKTVEDHDMMQTPHPEDDNLQSDKSSMNSYAVCLSKFTLP